MDIYFDDDGIKFVRHGDAEFYDLWVERDSWIVPRYSGAWTHIRYLMQFIRDADLIHAAYTVRNALEDFVQELHPETLYREAIRSDDCDPIAAAIVVHTIYNVDLSDHERDEDNHDEDLGCLFVSLIAVLILFLSPIIAYALLF